MRDLWLYYEHNQGFLDGEYGWILSWLAGQYRWFSHAKMLDVERQGANGLGETGPRGRVSPRLETGLGETGPRGGPAKAGTPTRPAKAGAPTTFRGAKGDIGNRATELGCSVGGDAGGTGFAEGREAAASPGQQKGTFYFIKSRGLLKGELYQSSYKVECPLLLDENWRETAMCSILLDFRSSILGITVLLVGVFLTFACAPRRRPSSS